MKEITRELEVYTHVFATFDENMQVVEVEKVVCSDKCGPRILQKMAADRGKTYVKTEVTKRRYSIPVESFISAAEEYARLHATDNVTTENN